MAILSPLAAGLDALNVSVQAAAQTFRTGAAVYSDVGRSLVNVQTGLIKGITGLDVSFNQFKTAFGGGINAAKSIQQQAAMVSQNLASVGAMFSNNIKDLPGSFTTRLRGALMLFEVGLRSNSSSLLSFTERVRIAGGDQQRATRELAKIYRARGMDIMALENLGEVISNAATANSVSFAKLITAVSDMTEATIDLRAISGPEGLENFTEAIAQFTAQFKLTESESGVSNLKTVLAAFMPGSGMFGELSRIVGEELIDKIGSPSTSPEDQAAALEEAIGKVGEFLDTKFQNFDTDTFLGRMSKQMAIEAWFKKIGLATAFQNLRDQMRQAGETDDGIVPGKDFWSEIWPGILKELNAQLMSSFKELGVQLTEYWESHGADFAEGLQEVLVDPLSDFLSGLFEDFDGKKLMGDIMGSIATGGAVLGNMAEVLGLDKLGEDAKIGDVLSFFTNAFGKATVLVFDLFTALASALKFTILGFAELVDTFDMTVGPGENAKAMQAFAEGMNPVINTLGKLGNTTQFILDTEEERKGRLIGKFAGTKDPAELGNFLGEAGGTLNNFMDWWENNVIGGGMDKFTHTDEIQDRMLERVEDVLDEHNLTVSQLNTTLEDFAQKSADKMADAVLQVLEGRQ